MNTKKDSKSDIRDCVFFSTQYPYETTLKREFAILSEHFERVFYFPTSIGTGIKEPLPDNFILNTMLADSNSQWKKLSVFQWIQVLSLYLTSMLAKGNLRSYVKGWKTYISIAARNIMWANKLKKFIQDNKLEHALFYDYWFENATLSIAILKKKGIIHKTISRSHRFDLYDESWNEGKVPFRKFKVKHLDAVFPVAKHGQEYFKSKLSHTLRHKIGLFYLGVEMPIDKNPDSKPNAEKLIISASNTREFKRVHLIPEILKKVDIPIKWIHFGTGPCDAEISKNISELPLHIKAELKGFIPNEEVLKFYSEQHVDLFISLSTSEGLPISMMESISYGIPVFACDVCGISDLVNDDTGGMFDEADNYDTIAEKLKIQLQKNSDKKKIIEFAAEKFDYKKNYTGFISSVISFFK